MQHDTMDGIVIVLRERAGWLSASEITAEFDERYFLGAEFKDAIKCAQEKGYIVQSTRGMKGKGEIIYCLTADGKSYARNMMRAKFGLTTKPVVELAGR